MGARRPPAFLSRQGVQRVVRVPGFPIKGQHAVDHDLKVHRVGPEALAYDRKVEFDRRRRFDIEGTPISVVAPEDLMLSKLQWSKDSGSELQRRDARSIVESVEDLDWSYLKIWAKDLGVRDLLEQVRTE